MRKCHFHKGFLVCNKMLDRFALYMTQAIYGDYWLTLHIYNYYVTICVQADAGLPDPMLEAAHTGTHDGHATLGRYHRILHIGAKVAEATNELHLVARSQDTIGYHTLFTIGLNFGFRPVDLESLFWCFHFLQGVSRVYLFCVLTQLRQNQSINIRMFITKMTYRF